MSEPQGEIIPFDNTAKQAFETIMRAARCTFVSGSLAEAAQISKRIESAGETLQLWIDSKCLAPPSTESGE